MKYISTRDGALRSTFEEAVTAGYAPDGGLFVPEHLPRIGKAELEAWHKLSFPELACRILRFFVSPDELSDDNLTAICTASYKGFENPSQPVPIRKLGSIYVAELFHGPTFCFKDLGMQPVIHLLSHFAKLRNRKTTLLVSTTGDTGPAAVRAVSDIANPLLTILVHYPDNQISKFQRRQLTTVQSPCVRVVTFQGGGDDMDEPIKRILTSPAKDSATNHKLCGVNSYNIGRPLTQMVHYVWTYLRVVEQLGVKPGEQGLKVDVVIPTGAMGNIVGGYMAKKMGLPLGMLCAGVNINDITYRVMQTGQFHKSQAMHKTLSDAINIQLPYNFERLLYYLTDGDDATVKAWMTTIEQTSKLDLDATWLQRLQREFRAARVTDEKMCRTIRTVRDEHGYVVDPHTAVAITAAEALGYKVSDEKRNVPVALLATASPCKFQESVSAALGEDGWNRYAKEKFPIQAEAVMEKPEVPPTLYPFTSGATLQEVQFEWEAMARDIIAELGTVDSNT